MFRKLLLGVTDQWFCGRCFYQMCWKMFEGVGVPSVSWLQYVHFTAVLHFWDTAFSVSRRSLQYAFQGCWVRSIQKP